jgi:hypothetical protein
MNTDETSNCHEVCPVFNWYNKHVPPHATRTFNKIFQDKSYFRSHYTVKCSSLVPMKYHHISKPPPPGTIMNSSQAGKRSKIRLWSDPVSYILNHTPTVISTFPFLCNRRPPTAAPTAQQMTVHQGKVRNAGSMRDFTLPPHSR